MTDSLEDDVYETDAQICRAYGGISTMTLWRWRQRLGFPQPEKINDRNYTRRSARRAWDEQRQLHRPAA